MRRPALRVTIQVTAILVLIGATLLVVGPVRREVERRISGFKVQAIEQIEDIIGREISYSSISPSVLRYLSVNDLTIHGLPDEPADLVTVQQLKVYYRPLALIRGELAEAFTEIRIESTTLTVDTRRDSDIVAIINDFAGEREAGGATSLIPDDLVLSGRNIDLRVASDIGIVRVDDLVFTSTAQDDVVSLRGEGDVQFLATSVDLPVSELEGRILANGTIDLNSSSALFDVNVPELHSDVASITNQVFQVSYANDVVEARKVRDRNPVDLYLRFEPEPMELYARILSDGYRLSNLVDLEGVYEQFNQYIDVPVRGQASATITEAGISYAGSVLTRTMGLPVPDGDVNVQFSGNTERVTIDRLEYRTDQGEVEFDGVVQFQPFRPDGRITVRDLVYGGIAPLSVSGRVQSTSDTVYLDTNRFTYAGVSIADVSGFLTLGENPFADATVAIGPDGERRLDFTTEIDPDGKLRNFTVDARSILPAQLEQIQQAVLPNLQLPNLEFLPDTMVVDTRISGNLTDGLSLEVPLFAAIDTARPEDHVSFALRYADDRVHVSDLTVTYDGYDGTGNFIADLGSDGSISFDSDVVVEDIPYEFTGVFTPGESLQISGLYDVDASFAFGERDELQFSARGNVPLPIAGNADTRLAFDGTGHFLSETDWAVTVANLSLAGLPYYAIDSCTVRVAGDFDPSGALLSEVEYHDQYSDLFGTGSIEWAVPEIAGTVELVLTDDEGAETYAATAGYDGAELTLSALFTELPLLRAGVTNVRGSVSGSVEVSGAPDALSTRVAATLNEGRFNGDLVEISGIVELDPVSVAVTDLNGRYVRTRFENLNGLLSLETGVASADGFLVQPNAVGKETTVGLEAIAEFGEGHLSFGDLVREDFSGRVVVSGIPVRNDLPEDWQFGLRREEGLLTFAGGPEDALSGTFNNNGEFTVLLTDPVPLEFTAVGRLQDGEIEADLTNVRADVAKLWRIVDSEGMAFVSGTGTGSLRLVGPLNDPDFYGTLAADNVTGSVDIISDLVGPFRTHLVFNEKLLSVRETIAPAGEGTARLSAAMTLDRWLPDEWRVWVDVLDDSPVRVVNDFGGVAIDGMATGDVVLTGAQERLLIEGDLVASAINITLSDVEPAGEAPEDTGDLIVDVNVTTGRGVEFVWPSDAFPILRGSADSGESVRITHRRSTNSHTVDGAVNIRGGEIFYFDRSFYIKEGRMVFAEDQTEFDPLLTVNAEIREVGPDGPVQIYLVSDERPLSEFTPQWRSDPPMAEADIIAMLGGNVFVTDAGDPINLSQAVLLTSDFVSQFGIIQGFESTIRDSLQLDLFSIRTQLFQNLIQGVLVQATDPDSLDNDVPDLGEYLDNTTLFVGKYLGTDLFLEMLVQLRASDTTTTLAGISVDTEFSLEWQTPFFQLEWSFLPTDPSTLFLTDNTISFAWEYSY